MQGCAFLDLLLGERGENAIKGFKRTKEDPPRPSGIFGSTEHSGFGVTAPTQGLEGLYLYQKSVGSNRLCTNERGIN